MKKLLSVSIPALLLSFYGFSQNTNFGKFLGSINPAKFIGSSVYKGYEKQVEIIEVTTNGQNQNTTVNFKFSPCSASADFLAHTQLGKNIVQGEIDVMEKNPNNPSFSRIKYKMYFEDARVLSCSDTRACNNLMATTVSLKPLRICWVYYNYDVNGKLLNSTSNGFDAKTGQSWTVTPPNF
ncbi:MAG: hypothetical protein JST86_01825 [Bacteroidetes bacterium]|nr:hypothetical protein [Bacteroidota bacterium]